MRELGPTYIDEIKKQRQRLRLNMTEAEFKTWHAQTLTVLDCVPGIGHLTNRFLEVAISGLQVSDKVQQSRQILTPVVQFVQSPLFGSSSSSHRVAPQTPGWPVIPSINVSQTQQVTQSINIDLNTLLERVDGEPDLSPEKKEEAKGLVRRLWQELTGRAKDMAAIADIVVRLTSLGINIQNILGGLQLG